MTRQPDTAVVFFSRAETPGWARRFLSERLNARLVELKERRPGNALQALLRRKTKLDGDPWKEISGVRRVYLMSPIWAGSTAPAMNAFAEGADFTDKDVYIVTFQKSPDQRQSHRSSSTWPESYRETTGRFGNATRCSAQRWGSLRAWRAFWPRIGKVRLPEDLPGEPMASAAMAAEEASAAPAFGEPDEAPVSGEAAAAEKDSAQIQDTA
jgi:hypothetical protein